VTGNDSDATDNTPQPETEGTPPADAHRSIRQATVAELRAHGRIARVLALVAVAAVIGAAYVAGGSPSAADHTVMDATEQSAVLAGGNAAVAAPVPAATAATLGAPTKNGAILAPAAAATTAVDGTSSTTGQDQALAAADASQIVKTGQMTLEVTDIDAALTKAQSAISGLGGSVDSSSRDGTGDQATASITFRVPVGKWDSALSALHKIGTKVLSEQTGASDVTGQVVDLNARLDNLRTTEAALQSIMGRAVAIADVIAVENQLSNVQGQIEELTAQIAHLKDQAAMSTVTVAFQLPAQTVTTQATQDWTLGSQVDQAGAALVRIGQGLATMGVWCLIVVLPLAGAALALFLILALARRIFGRARRRSAAIEA
jgi:hypothetical protein